MPLSAIAVAVTVCVRLHDAFGIGAAVRHEAIRRVEKVLHQVGVSVDWAACDSDGKSPPDRRCLQPPLRGEIVLRLLHSPKDKFDGSLPFGYAVIDAGTGEGTLATVYPDRVERLALSAGEEMADLLGDAMAHEVGHLLLGRAGHSASGLMREHWRIDEVQRRWSADWTFSPEEERQIRARAATTLLAQARTR